MSTTGDGAQLTPLPPGPRGTCCGKGNAAVAADMARTDATNAAIALGFAPNEALWDAPINVLDASAMDARSAAQHARAAVAPPTPAADDATIRAWLTHLEDPREPAAAAAEPTAAEAEEDQPPPRKRRGRVRSGASRAKAAKQRPGAADGGAHDGDQDDSDPE